MAPPFRRYEGKNILRHVSGKDYAVAVDIQDAEISLDTSEAMPTSESWRVALQAEETANDSDKTFTVPAGTEWQILSIWVELASSADVGARQMTVQMLDSADDVIGQFKAGATQAASLTYLYMFAPGLELMSAVVGTYLSFPLPPMFLPAGFKVRVYDSAAVAAAADDMVIQMMVAARTV